MILFFVVKRLKIVERRPTDVPYKIITPRRIRPERGYLVRPGLRFKVLEEILS
jgi:hypothetical protein